MQAVINFSCLFLKKFSFYLFIQAVSPRQLATLGTLGAAEPHSASKSSPPLGRQVPGQKSVAARSLLLVKSDNLTLHISCFPGGGVTMISLLKTVTSKQLLELLP